MADLNTADVVTAVRAKLSDTAFDQTLIIDALNFFVDELYHNTRTRRMETNDEIFVGINETTAEMPDDIDTLISLTVTDPTTNIFDLTERYMEYRNFMKFYPKWRTDTARAIDAWTDFGNEMRFAAPALTATTLEIDYCRKPVRAVLATATATDTIELDDSYKELAVLGALARCMESNEDYAEADNERDNLSTLVTAWIRNEARGGFKTGPTVIRTNRGRATGWRADRDF